MLIQPTAAERLVLLFPIQQLADLIPAYNLKKYLNIHIQNFLFTGEEEVKVDESLFQELDDLELQEEDLSN